MSQGIYLASREPKVPEEGFTAVTLPKSLVEAAKEFVKKHRELGYTSLAEFVKEAVRTRMVLLDSDADYDEEDVKRLSLLLRRKQATIETVLGSRISSLETEVRELKRTRSKK